MIPLNLLEGLYFKNDVYYTPVAESWASQVAQLVKNLPSMQETLVQFLGQEVPLEKG